MTARRNRGHRYPYPVACIIGQDLECGAVLCLQGIGYPMHFIPAKVVVTHCDLLPSIFQKILVFVDKSNLSLLFLRWFQELTQHIKHYLELLIIFLLKLFEFGGKLFLG